MPAGRPPRSCDHATYIAIDERKFRVEFNADGEVLRIKERKLYAPGTYMERLYEASYWVPSSHPIGNGKYTLPRRIIAAARAKLNPVPLPPS